ncbi:MAG: diguanylate cyclase [Coriobacteriales bacterium]|jgi:diguanylate cyclase (GGDEF)-like protein|nr:diguanylate cyclase [Coriobacteriales bacterium]
MDPTAQQFFDYLKDAIYEPEHAKLDPKDVPEDFRNFAKGLIYYVTSVREASVLATDIARGELNTSPLSPGNEVAAGVKSLQAALRHLTWQTQQVAKGDYNQKVSFMGDFSEAMNYMISQLAERHESMQQEIKLGHEQFEALTAEVSELESSAFYDPATNTYNRRFGMNKLNEWLEEKREFVICFIDLDNLKFVNDEFGHNEGDVYILMATELLKQFSETGLVCRLGGDEFMIIDEGWTQQRAERRLAELRTNLLSANEHADIQYYHSMSYGVVEVVSGNDVIASELLGVADERMYSFKRAHKAERKTY